MEIPVIVGDRLRYRIRWRFARLRRIDDGYELGLWSHPALQVAMTPAGFEFNQIDWYTVTISYKHRRLPRDQRGGIEPARLLVGMTLRRLGFVYLGIYLTDWLRMFGAGEIPLEVGHMRLGTR